jgi:hypothetical protein
VGDQAVSLSSPALAQGVIMSISYSTMQFLSKNRNNQISNSNKSSTTLLKISNFLLSK